MVNGEVRLMSRAAPKGPARGEAGIRMQGIRWALCTKLVRRRWCGDVPHRRYDGEGSSGIGEGKGGKGRVKTRSHVAEGM